MNVCFLNFWFRINWKILLVNMCFFICKIEFLNCLGVKFDLVVFWLYFLMDIFIDVFGSLIF